MRYLAPARRGSEWMDFMSEESGNNIIELLKQEFPIVSQTSLMDKATLLQARNIVHNAGTYTYCEVGSYLGGSLTPFLRDECCQFVLSIDEREREMPDVSGKILDYSGVTHQKMLKSLAEKGFDIEKIETFDGSINQYNDDKTKFDIMFIDGEHTDFACFRDFIHGRKFLKENCIVLFHDSHLIYNALRNIQAYLASTNKSFKYIKVKDTSVSIVFLGSYNHESYIGQFNAEDNLEKFYKEAEDNLIKSIIKNRVSFSVDYTLNDAPISRAYSQPKD